MTPAMLKGASTASVSAALCDAVEASDGVDVDVHEHGNSSRPADSADPDPAPEALIADRLSQPGRREAIRRLIGAGIAHATL